MRTKILATAAVVALAGVASADVFDISGPVDGAAPRTLSFTQVTTEALAAISFDLNYTPVSPSWGSEVHIDISHSSGFAFSASGDGDAADVGFGWIDDSTAVSFSGSFAVTGLADTSGVWTIVISDDFDDFGVDGDLQGTVEIKKVPAPASLALLGLGGLVAGRRRR